MNHGFDKVKTLLFVCTGNCARSVMAEALAKHLVKEHQLDVMVSSAGTNVKNGMLPTEFALKTLKADEITIESHQARECTKEHIDEADLILVMEKNHVKILSSKFPHAKEKISLLSDFDPQVEPWLKDLGIPDPFGMSEHFYMNVYKVIKRSCAALINQIKTPVPELSKAS